MLGRGEQAACPRCGLPLERDERLGPREMLAVCLTALVAFILANVYPLVTMEVQGMVRQASLLEAIGVTWQQPGMWGVALMAMLTAFALPLGQLLLLLALLLMLLRPSLPGGFDQATRVLRWFRPWSMIPVFVLGVLVAIVKIADLASIVVGVGLWSMGALVVLLTILSRLDSRMLWRFAEESGATRSNPERLPSRQRSHHLLACDVCGYVHDAGELRHARSQDWLAQEFDRCLRCDSPLHVRKPDSLSRTWAFLITGMLLYIPANLLPIMQTRSLFDASAHTIMGGVVELWEGGAWDIALVVFIASVAVPFVKFVVLFMLLAAARRAQRTSLIRDAMGRPAQLSLPTSPAPAAGATGSRRRPRGRLGRAWDFARGKVTATDALHDHRARAKLYRFIEFIGQWSMLDVFVVLLLGALVNFQGLMQVTAGFGAIAFGLTVVFTMLAAMSFDPRLIWDGQPALVSASNNDKATEPGEVHARQG